MKHVFIDVFAWIKACETHGYLVMEGIFRHGEYLGRTCQPAAQLMPNEHLMPEAVALVEKHLNQKVLILHTAKQFAEAGCKVWVSLAVDFPAPLVSLKTPFKKLAILHDTMAGDGMFGKDKVSLFIKGAHGNDFFAYVSTYALTRFLSDDFCFFRNPKGKYIKYGNFHSFAKLEEVAPQDEVPYLLSVHSLFKRKNVEDEILLSERLGCRFLHIGANREYEKSWIDEQNAKPKVTLAGFVSEQVMRACYARASYFACLSTDEGFSMPAMEAIILGCPHIFLSDIPAHREIYGDTSAEFLPARRSDWGLLSIRRGWVTPEQRTMIFERHKADNVAQELLLFLADQKI